MRQRMIAGICLLLAGMHGHAQALPDAVPAPTGLPDPAIVEKTLLDAPRLRIAVESVAHGEALSRRLAAGPHEWEVQSLTQQRKDALGATHTEQEYALQTGVRWAGKAGLDRRIGAAEQRGGQLSYQDAWHEAGRELLDLWFEWVGAEQQVRLHGEQLTVLERQREAVVRRVAAGDAPALEQQLAEAETGRQRASLSEAQRAARMAREALRQQFPGLPFDATVSLQDPPLLPGVDAQWIARIVEENHEIELAVAKQESAQLTAERVRRDRLADPVLGLRYSNNLDGDRRVLGLQVTLPLGGALRSADTALARSAARRADAEVDRARQAVEAGAQSVVADARLSREAWLQQQAAQRALDAAAEASARGYALGEFDLASLLAARREALRAGGEQLDARLRAARAYARVLLDAHLLWTAPGHD